MENQDERGNLPSASKLERVVACPGSENLIASLPEKSREVIDVPDASAERGTRIHKARETGNTLDLDEEEMATYQRGTKFEADLLAAWKNDFDIKEAEEHLEERIWLFDDDLERVASGRLDVFYLAGERALACDWKSGFATYLTPSPRNFQLRLAAILLRREYGVKHVRVALIKPKLKRENVDWVDYSEQDLIHAEYQIFFHLWQAKQPDALRHAGDHCKYCEAKAYCREALGYSMLPSVIASRTMPLETKEGAELVVQSLPLADLLRIFEISRPVDWIITAVYARLKSLPTEELKGLGLEIGLGRKLEKIINCREAFGALQTEGFSEDDLWLCLDMGKTPIIDLVAREKNLSKADAGTWVDKKLNEFIKRDRAAGTLKKIA